MGCDEETQLLLIKGLQLGRNERFHFLSSQGNISPRSASGRVKLGRLGDRQENRGRGEKYQDSRSYYKQVEKKTLYAEHA